MLKHNIGDPVPAIDSSAAFSDGLYATAIMLIVFSTVTGPDWKTRKLQELTTQSLYLLCVELLLFPSLQGLLSNIEVKNFFSRNEILRRLLLRNQGFLI